MKEKEPRRDEQPGTPFSGEMKGAEFGHVKKPFETSPCIREFRRNPEKIVRRDSLDGFVDKLFDFPSADLAEWYKLARRKEKIKFAVGAVAEANRKLGGLKKFGFQFDAKFVLGKDERGDDAVFTVTSKVHGGEIGDQFNVNEARKDEAELAHFRDELDKLYSAQIAYLEDAFSGKGAFLWDIAPDYQYIYGKKKEDLKNHIYLVDIEVRQKKIDDISGFLDEIFYVAVSLKKAGDVYGIDARKHKEKLLRLLNSTEEQSGGKYLPGDLSMASTIRRVLS